MATAMQAGYLLSRVLLTPVILAHAGFAAYGFWSLMFAVLGVIGVQRMGLVSASVPLAARALADGDEPRARRILRTVASIALILSTVVGALALFADDLILSLVRIPDELLSGARWALRVTVGATCVLMVFGGYHSFLEAAQRHSRLRTVDGIAQISEAILVVVLLQFAAEGGNAALVVLSIAYALRLLIPIPIIAFLARRAGARGFLGPGPIDRAELGSVIRLGGAIQGLGALHMTILALPRLALARALDLGAAGLFDVARKLIDFSAALPARATEPLISASGALGANQDAKSVRREVTRTATRVIGSFGLLLLGVLAMNSEVIALAWLGDVPESFTTLTLILAPAAWIHLCTGPITAVLRGGARPRLEIAYTLIWIALLFAGLMWAAPRGLTVAAFAIAGAQVTASVTLLIVGSRIMGSSLRNLVEDLARPVAAFLPSFASVVAVSDILGAAGTRTEALVALSILATVFAIAALPGVWWLVFTERERGFVAARVSMFISNTGLQGPVKRVGS
ncbi:MAG: lipopolysaccharide biosynthesis protein [Planctomycetota bacterium]